MMLSKTVLIVDDSEPIRIALSDILQESGCKVIQAANGQEGLTQLNGQKIHLIVSDLNMPKMNGLEFVKLAKEVSLYKYTPVVMLTTESGKAFMDQGKQAGVKAWLIKPFKREMILQVLKKII